MCGGMAGARYAGVIYGRAMGKFFFIFFLKNLVVSKFCRTFAPDFKTKNYASHQNTDSVCSRYRGDDR